MPLSAPAAVTVAEAVPSPLATTSRSDGRQPVVVVVVAAVVERFRVPRPRGFLSYSSSSSSVFFLLLFLLPSPIDRADRFSDAISDVGGGTVVSLFLVPSTRANARASYPRTLGCPGVRAVSPKAAERRASSRTCPDRATVSHFE